MSIQELYAKKDEEIELIHKVITHPAAFAIDMFGDLLTIRSHCDGYEVAWKEFLDGMECNFHRDFRHEESMEAATFFIEKRYQLECGIDIEFELMKEKNE